MRITRSHFEQFRFVLGTFLSCGSILFFSQMPAKARTLVLETAAAFTAEHSPALATIEISPVSFTAREILATPMNDVEAGSLGVALATSELCLDPESSVLKLQDEREFERNQQIAIVDLTTPTRLGVRLEELLRAPETVTVNDGAAGCFDEILPISPEISTGVQTLAASGPSLGFWRTEVR